MTLNDPRPKKCIVTIVDSHGSSNDYVKWAMPTKRTPWGHPKLLPATFSKAQSEALLVSSWWPQEVSGGSSDVAINNEQLGEKVWAFWANHRFLAFKIDLWLMLALTYFDLSAKIHFCQAKLVRLLADERPATPTDFWSPLPPEFWQPPNLSVSNYGNTNGTKHHR